MQEGQVTVDGEPHPLPDPFLVVATQNPVEYEGTYPLPEAQRDRFLVRVDVGYPAEEAERALLRLARRGLAPSGLDAIAPVADAAELRAARDDASTPPTVAPEVLDYLVAVVRRTRELPERRARARARARPSTCSARRRRRRGWPGATSSRPTTSSAWPCPCCATGWCSRPRPSWSATRPRARCAARSTRCRSRADAA